MLLSALAVITLSSPVPDESAYNIPNVGTGRRSQYYVLHSDGTYKYGHDTGEGAYESARSHRVGEVDGNFGYRDPDGNAVHLQYEAGQEGFVPTGSHLPQPHPDFAAAHAEARARSPFRDPLADPNTDASYGFQFAEGGQARSEQSDSDGNIRGSYTYTDDEGHTRTISYTAGRGTGFVVESDDLPQAPLAPGATPAATKLTGAPGRFPSSTYHTSSAAAAASRAAATSSTYRSSTTSRRPTHSFRGTTASAAAGTASSLTSDIRPDGSYSFSFDAGDHSRAESADANLNVDGEFSFVADDGVRRQVTYEAGSDTGFIAVGDHLPQDHRSHAGARGSTSAFSRTRSPFRTSTTGAPFTGTTSAFQGTGASRRPTFTGTQTQYSTSAGQRRQPFEAANTRSQLNPDGSYSFEYQTSTHSRAEAGDRDNNVVGDFDFVADDGVRRAIEYEAGSATGFIAKGDHIPVGPVVPGAPSGQPTGDIVPVREVAFIDPLAGTGLDASYSFDFDSEQYSRTESADADGNVQGQYTVVDDDGLRRTYRFQAGKGIGFQTEEVSSSQGPRPRPTSSAATGRLATSPTYTGRPTPSTSFTGQSGTTFSHGSRAGASSSTTASSYASSSSRSGASEDFKLRQYDASDNRDKFGYVLTFD